MLQAKYISEWYLNIDTDSHTHTQRNAVYSVQDKHTVTKIRDTFLETLAFPRNKQAIKQYHTAD